MSAVERLLELPVEPAEPPLLEAPLPALARPLPEPRVPLPPAPEPAFLAMEISYCRIRRVTDT
jgi:hypothetical protein